MPEHDDELTILIVEDEEAVRRSMAAYLSDCGFHVMEAANGREGLEVLGAVKPDLLLLDLRMPEVDGLQVLSRLRDLHPDLPVIVVSGVGVVSDAVEALRRGAWDFLLKPIEDLSVLRHAVDMALERATLIEDNRRYREHLEEEVEKRTLAFREANEQLTREVSTRIATEEELDRSRRRLDSILRSVPDIIYRVDGEGRILFVNEAVRRYGYRPEDLIGRDMVDLVHPEDRSVAITRFVPSLADESESTVEIRIIARNGEALPFDVISFPVELDPFFNGIDASGRPIPSLSRTGSAIPARGVQGIARDISLRKKAEAERQRLAAAMDQSAEAVIITDVKGDVVYVNTGFERTTGHLKDEVVGRSITLLDGDEGTFGADGARSRSFHHIRWDTLLRGESWSGRFTHRKKNGEEYEAEGSISPVRDETGSIIHFVSVHRDISEAVRLENQLRQAQKMEALGQLAGGIAHDFNNLLTAIQGNAELLEIGVAKDTRESGYAAEIAKAAKRAAEMTRQLLAFSRRGTRCAEAVDLHELLDDVTSILSHSIDRRITIEIERRADAYEITGDPAQIQNALINLGVNARDAMPEGGRLVFATKNVKLPEEGPDDRLLGAAPGTYLRVEVRDTGVGMEETVRQRIFEPFFTTKDSEKGTGLGMAGVYGCVKDHLGFVKVKSAPGKGTVVSIYLPLAETEMKPIPSATEAEPERGKGRILLVDDEEIVRNFASKALRSLGYEVTVREDGADGFETFEADPDAFDLVILDLNMPRLDGLGAFRKISDLKPSTRVLLASGYGLQETVDAFLEEGGAGLLRKPFHLAALAAAVKKALA